MFRKIQALKKLLIILLILSGKSAFSQVIPVNTIDINTIYIPSSKYDQKDGNAANTEKTQKRIDLGYSFLISNKTDTTTKKINSWTALINGSYTQMSGKSSEKDLMPNRLLSSEVGVVYYHSLRNKWGMVSILTAGINSDLKKIDSHDLFVNGGLLFIKNYSPRFSFGFGAFVANAFNAPIILPALVLNLKTEGKLKFNIDLPTEVSTAYDVNKKMELKLALRFRNISYDVENKMAPEKRYLNYLELPLGLEGKWRSKHFDFILGGGYMFLRNFEYREAGLKNTFNSVPTNKLNGNMYINAGIKYRLQTVSKPGNR